MTMPNTFIYGLSATAIVFRIGEGPGFKRAQVGCRVLSAAGVTRRAVFWIRNKHETNQDVVANLRVYNWYLFLIAHLKPTIFKRDRRSCTKIGIAFKTTTNEGDHATATLQNVFGKWIGRLGSRMGCPACNKENRR
jgi:hypothetical protein